MILLLLAVSCQKDPLDFQDAETATGSPVNLEGYRTKMPNPYTVANMQKAWKQIEKQVKGNHGVMAKGIAKLPQQPKIVPNLLYIKFTPQNEAQHNKIDGTTLALTDYPLGYAYEDAFFENRPPLKEGELRPLYTTVPVGTELPSGVPYEVLVEMYLPQEDEGLTQVASSFTYQTAKGKTVDVIGLLLNQAWTQKGVSLEDEADQAARNKQNSRLFGGLFGDKWLPEGTIRIWDDNIGSTVIRKKVFDHWETYPCVDLEGDHDKFNEIPKARASLFAPRCRRPVYRYDKIEIDGSYVPLAGAQILLRSIWTIGNEITNSEGYFRFDHKRGRKRYIIQWERAKFDIRNGAFGQAETRGSKTDRAWNYKIKDGHDEYYGTIFQAAHLYYYGDIKGLRRPPLSMMKIGAYYESNSEVHGDHAAWRRFLGAYPQIRIYNPNRKTVEIFGTTIHELAHASHWGMDHSDFNNTDKIVVESWARGVQRALSKIVYSKYEPPYFDIYTGIVQDMMDGESWHDKVSGYSIEQIEDALIHQTTWNAWRNNLKRKYNNETENKLDALFANWN